jgi:XTP/dITP diphosphohydrolase
MKILFATSNTNKAKEISEMLPESFELITLKDINLNEEIPETSNTIEGNARQKANYIKDNFKIDCFADDTGLEVAALNNEPGVKSARYAGDHRSDQDNMNLLLNRLENKGRNARFKTVIALYINQTYHEFEGIVEGQITLKKTGENGFGYDPIFEPENCGKTFAEMDINEKNKYSHRARAFSKMLSFLNREFKK